MRTLRFDQAFALLAEKLAKESEAVRNEAMIIRDLYGKLHIALPASREKADELDRSIGTTWEELGLYAPSTSMRVYLLTISSIRTRCSRIPILPCTRLGPKVRWSRSWTAR